MSSLRRVALLAFAVSCVSTLGLGGQGFTSAPVLPVAGDPVVLATGDFNRDGKPDLAYLDAATGGNLHILLGNGDGSFRAGQVMALPSGAGGQIDVADMNGDGIPDLIVTGDSLHVLLGRGDGQFAAPVNTPFSGYGYYTLGHLALADFDGDGKLDAFVAGGSNASIQKGDGKGGFAGTIYLADSTLEGPDAFAADLNGDGRPDLIALKYNSGFAVALNLGNGSFAPAVSYSGMLAPTGIRTLALADIDGDGHLDVVLSVIKNLAVFPGPNANVAQVLVAAGRADGTFAPVSALASPKLHSFSIPGVADLQRDGRARIFVAGNEGYGTLLGATPAGSPMVEGSGIRPAQTVIADINGDGIPDMVTPDDHSLVLLLGKPDGTFASVQAQESGTTLDNVLLADANGDHVPDLILNAGLVYAGVGDGTFQTLPLQPPPGYGTPTDNSGGSDFPLYPANFNADGKLDLLSLPEAFLTGNGDGSFTQRSAPRVMGTPFYFGAVADFDGDGLDDGVETSGGAGTPPLGGINIFMSRAQAFTAFNLPNNENPGPMITGDFDGDGCQDLAVGAATEVVLYRGDCHGNLTHTVSYSYTLPAGVTRPSGFANQPIGDLTRADVDGDGHVDLIFTLPFLKEAEVLYGNGDGTFVLSLPIALSRAAIYVSAADLDNDGRADLAFSGIGDPILLYGSADRTFGPERVLAGGFQTGRAAMGDLRGIGKTDLVLPNLNTYKYDLFTAVGFTYARFLNAAPAAGSSAVSVALTLPGSSVSYGTAAPGTVRVTPASSSFTPSGFLSLQVDGAPFASAALDGSGQASFSLAALDAGNHNITAIYLGDVNFRTGSANSTLAITPAATALSFIASPSPATTLTAVNLSAAVTAGGAAPFGQVQFLDGTAVLGSAPLNASGLTTLSVPALSAGTHQLSAAFAATQDLLGSQNSVALQVNPVPSTTSVTVSPASSAFGSSVVIAITVGTGSAGVQATGNVTCAAGNTSLGTAPLANGNASLTTTALPAGDSTVTCAFPGDTLFAPSTSAGTAVHVSRRFPATLTLGATVVGAAVTSSIAAGTPLTLTVLAVANGAPVTPGQVQICDGGTFSSCTGSHLLATAQLLPNGSATVTVVPAPGAHMYSALLLGLPAVLPTQSANLPVTVTGSVLSTANLSATGVAGNYTLTAELTATGNAPSGSVNFVDLTAASQALGSAPLVAATGSGSFAFNATALGTPALVFGVQTGDFNGDGYPDLALASGANGGIQILLGKGDGTFTAGQSVQTAPAGTANVQTSALVLGDFNGDGHTDIAALNTYDSALTVFLGNGDGTFAALPRDGSTSHQGIFSMTVADVNGDGKADIVGADESNHVAILLLGKGDGTFQNTSGPQLPPNPRKVITGDFNGDGIADLAFSTGGEGALAVLLGAGDGTFTQMATPSTGPTPISVTAGDFNGDGHLDLAVTNDGSATVSILLGAGDGTFQTLSTTYPTGNAPIDITAGDFNGDGKTDLAIANELNNSVTLLLGNGDGTFIHSALPVGKQPEFVTAVDLNGDGRTDLVVGNVAESDATLLLARGSAVATATLAKVTPTGEGVHQVQASYAGDSTYPTRLTNTVSLAAQTAATALSLTADPVQSSFGQPVTVTATLTATGLDASASDGEAVTILNGTATLGTCVLKAGTCTLSLTNLAVGNVTLSATFAGDPALSASTAAPLTLSIRPAQAPITFIVANHTFGDAPFSLYATSSGSGSFSFSVVSGPATLSGVNVTLTGAGTVVLRVDEAASGNYAASSQTATITVAPAAQTLTLSLPATAVFGASPVAVTSSSSSGLPVSLSVISGPAVLSGNGLSFTGAGTVVVAADQAGNNDYKAAAQVRQTIQVTRATLTLNWPPPAPLTYGATLQGALTATASLGTSPIAGSITYALGSTSVTGATVLNAGTYTLTAQFTPADSNNYAPAVASVPLGVGKAAAGITLSTAASSLFTGNPLVLSASVSSPSGVPSGSVTFLNGTEVLGTASLTGGVAQFTVPALPVGSQSLSAVYAGNEDFTGNASAPVTETVQDFTVDTGSSAPVITAQGSTATATFTLNATGQTLPDAVTFSASGLPPGATATFSPASLPAGSTAKAVTVTFTLPATVARLHGHASTPLVTVALLLLPFSTLRSRRLRALLRSRAALCLLGSLCFSALLLSASGCGGGGSSAQSAPTPQSYTVTLTATSGALQHSTTVTLQVR